MGMMVRAVVLGIALLEGCSGESSKQNCERLRTDLEAATRRAVAAERALEEFKNGPTRLLADAKAALSSKRYEAALAAAEQLLARHPGDASVPEATSIRTAAQRELAAAAERRKQEEEKARQAESAKRAAALKALTVKKDDIRGIEFYRHKDSTQYLNTRSDMQLSFSARQGRPETLFFQIQYVADDWLFIERLTIKADEQVFEINPKRGELERDNGGGQIWEWYETPVGLQEQRIIDAVFAAKTVTIRHNGRQYYKDRKISAAEVERMRQVLVAYKALQNGP